MSGDMGSLLSSIQSSLAEGKDPMDVQFGSSGEPAVSDSDEGDEGSSVVEGDVSAEEASSATEGESVGEESKVAEASGDAEDKPKEEDLEVLKTKSGTEVKISYSDRAAIKQNALMALGARKWQAERDAAQAKLKELEPDYKDAVEFRSSITSAFEKSGLEGLVNLLTNDAEGYKKFIAQELAVAKQYESASPEQRALLDERRANEQLKKELEADRKAREKQIQDAEAKSKLAAEREEQAQLVSFQEITGTSQKKFSFVGKLDNPDIEEALDSKVWGKVRGELERLPDETEITPKLMDSLFSKHFESLQKGLNVKTAKEADKKVAEKKKEAQTKVAASAASAMGKKTAVEEFDEAGAKGDFASMLKMAFSGKVKMK
jgi:hypothetical protein